MDTYVIQVHDSIQALRKEYANAESIKDLFKQCSYFKIPYDTYSVWKNRLEKDPVHIYLGLADGKIIAYFVNARFDCEEMIEDMTADQIFEVQPSSEIDEENIDMNSFVETVNGNLEYNDVATECFHWIIARNSWVQSQIDKVPTNGILNGFKLADNAVMATFGEGEHHADNVYMFPGLFLSEDINEKIGISMVFWTSYIDGEGNLISGSNNLTYGCPPGCRNEIYYLSFPEI